MYTLCKAGEYDFRGEMSQRKGRNQLTKKSHFRTFHVFFVCLFLVFVCVCVCVCVCFVVVQEGKEA